ncbi:MAG: VOC family protein [Chroococcidiopsidaceae cyanobacterium CP_BM_RX_35]|nr:VOC family protein [Chroococcidiopsidaceae cyanobacterium CP_BM_RX_35]
MQITQFLHTAILVSNLEQAEHFYHTVLGLTKVERSLKYAGAWYQIGECQLHLIVAPDYVPNKLQNPEKWGRNPHVALAIADLDAAKEQLLAHKCPMQMSASGRAALFIQDPDGNIIELGQRSPGGSLRELR